ncbi:MAG: acetyl-CoA carboxylase biotin carboxyl carrier protein [Hyphomicrobiales bacterium]
MARSPKKEKIDKGLIRDLAELLNETALTEIEIEQEGVRVRVSRAAQGVSVAAAPVAVAEAPAPAAAAPAPEPAPAAASDEIPANALTSPMVGTAYLAPAPGADPFVKVGDTVSQGQTLMIIEAMKTMNQIPSPASGKVTGILVESGQPVEFGEPLMVIE